MLALATGLMDKGYEVVFCASPDNEEFVKSHHCPFEPFGKNLKELFSKANVKGGISAQMSPKEGRQIIAEQIEKLPEKVKGSDIILAAGIILGVPTVADYLNIPYRFVAFYPMILGTSKEDPLFNRTMFRFGRFIINLFTKGYINSQRQRLGIQSIKDVWQYWMGDNVIIACDRELNAVKEGVSFKYTQTGYMILSAHDKLQPRIEDFLASGKPPVYIGFGSNPISGKKEFGDIFNKVFEDTQQRLIISKGWADLPSGDQPNILFVDDIPFNSLFPKVSAIIHHGGTGTMAYAARSGVPQAAFPFIADQFENRKQIVRLGLGPETCDFKKMTAESLSSAIMACITNDDFRKNAIAISKKLEQTDGLELTIDVIERALSEPLSYRMQTI